MRNGIVNRGKNDFFALPVLGDANGDAEISVTDARLPLCQAVSLARIYLLTDKLGNDTVSVSLSETLNKRGEPSDLTTPSALLFRVISLCILRRNRQFSASKFRGVFRMIRRAPHREHRVYPFRRCKHQKGYRASKTEQTYLQCRE